MNKIAVYTAIFGPFDGLLPQIKIKGVDYICFTDQPFTSKTWQIKHIDPVFEDSRRNSRRIKVLPHLFLQEYEYSIFMDGNYLIRRDIKPLLFEKLADANMAIFDHNQCEDARNCVYDEYESIIRLMEEKGVQKDDPKVLEQQIDRYKSEGYPEQNGLIFSAVLFRKHNEADVVKTMECWWDEIKNNSKRDQLSFNYAAWKTNLKFNIIDGDLRNNKWFFMIGAHRPDYSKKLFRYRLKRFFGLLPKSKAQINSN